MSIASDRQRHGVTLAAYALVSLKVAAAFLDVKVETVKLMISDGELPAIPVRKRFKIDPLALAVHALAGQVGLTAEEYWAKYGDATPEHAGRYLNDIRKFQAAA